MKKLMLGLAIAAVGSAFAVESSNIVGYLNGDLVQGGRNAKTPAFISVNNATSIKLSELRVVGYGEDGLDLGGCWGNVSIRMLNAVGANQRVGTMAKSYLWFDEEGEYEAGWYDSDETPLKDDASPLGNADEITFAAGEAFTVFTDDDYVGCQIVSAGQVFTSQLNYTLTTGGRNMVGNPIPTSIALSEITVSGYGEDGLDLGGCWGNVSIRMLNAVGANQKVGTMAKSYLWFDEEGEYEAGWYDSDETPLKNDESALGNADEITFAAGEGLVVFVDDDYVGCTINFPAL